jgi:hypothetical protein
MKNLKNFVSWEKARLAVFETADHVPVYTVHQWAGYLRGVLISSFQIGDTPYACPVASKYPGMVLECQESNSLLGVRPFENDSLTYEFLWKPLGLLFQVAPPDLPTNGKDGWQKLWSSLDSFERHLKSAGGKRLR